MSGPIRTSRLRHLRHRRLDGVTRGAEGSKGIPRLKRVEAWLFARADTAANGGIGDTAVTDDFVASGTVAASGILTLSANAGDGEFVTIGSVTYTFQTVLVDTANNVLIGALATDSIDNLISAILDTGVEGTDYGTGTVVHPDVTAAAGAGDTMDVDAKLTGTDGNLIGTTTDVTGSFGATTLEGGLDDTTMTATTHGLTTPSGPLVLTTTDTLPLGLPLNTLIWGRAVDTNNLSFHRTRDGAVFNTDVYTATDAGTGTHSFARAADIPGLIEWLRQDNDPVTIQALTDIDDL